jgi:hypothetical protein
VRSFRRCPIRWPTKEHTHLVSRLNGNRHG